MLILMEDIVLTDLDNDFFSFLSLDMQFPFTVKEYALNLVHQEMLHILGMMIIVPDVIERGNCQGVDGNKVKFTAVVEHKQGHMTTDDAIVNAC